MAKAFSITSGRWLRTAPEESSTPLHTTSYWYARISPGSLLSRASRPPWGIENGLWEKSQPPVSGLRSYMGKSTIQQNARTLGSCQAELVAERGATWPRATLGSEPGSGRRR